MSTRLNDYVEQAGQNLDEAFASTRQQVIETVDEYPLTVTLAALGVGVVAGLCVASLLTSEPSRRRTAESWGRQMYDSLRQHMPDAVGSRM